MSSEGGGNMKRWVGEIALAAACVTAVLIMSTGAMAHGSALTEPWASSAAVRSHAFLNSSHLSSPSGSGIIRGTVLDYSGQPVPAAYLMWLTADWEASGGAQTDATGSYEMTGVPAAAGTGEIWLASAGDAEILYFCSGLTFLDPGPNTFDFWPGRLPLTIQRGGPWAGGSSASVDLFGSNGTSPMLETDQFLRVGSADTFIGYAYGLPGDYAGAVVTFRGGGWPARRTEAQEIEMPQGAPAVVQSGQTGGVSLVADERDAVRAKVTRWASGAPGSMVTLRLSNLRAGDVYKITGESMNGHEPVKTFATVTVPSLAPPAMSLKVRVPIGVPTGDKYNFEASGVGGHLQLVASYQVCAFKASRHSIARGESVKLRGRVPIIPGDSGPNTSMTLTLFKHAGEVGQPWTWQAKAWTKVTTIRTDFMNGGRFSTPYQHPRRTTSYVIRYPRSFDPSWRGFTSVETVHVN
jgi:hypothetical protein